MQARSLQRRGVLVPTTTSVARSGSGGGAPFVHFTIPQQSSTVWHSLFTTRLSDERIAEDLTRHVVDVFPAKFLLRSSHHLGVILVADSVQADLAVLHNTMRRELLSTSHANLPDDGCVSHWARCTLGTKPPESSGHFS